MGERYCSLDQLYKKFSENDVFPSPKLNEDQTQGLCRKLKSFFPKSGEDQKKKVFAAIFDHFRQEICRIFESWLAIFPLVIRRSTLDGERLNLGGGTLNLDGGTLILDGGTLNLDGGTLILDGGTHPPASPLQFKYCL